MKILATAGVRWFNAEADYALRVAAGLAARGHEVHFGALAGKTPAERAQRAGLRVIATDGLNAANPAALLGAYRRLRAHLAEERYDLLVANRPEGYPLLARAARAACVTTAVVRVRGEMRPPRSSPFNHLLFHRWTDGFVASGEVVAGMLADRLAVPADRVRVIHYGVDTGRFRPGLPETVIPGLAPDAPVVGYVGRFDRIKGRAHFPALVRLVAGAVPGVKFVVAVKAERNEPARFRELVAQAGLADSVLVLGQIPDPAALMNRFSVGFVSSIGSEANARVLTEMMACGVPTAVTRVGVLAEVVDEGRTGFVVPPNRPEALAAAVIRILKDEGNRRTMSAAARARVVERFSLETMLDRTADWYREILNRTSSSSSGLR